MNGFEKVDYQKRLKSLIARRAGPVVMTAKAARYGKSLSLESEVYNASPVYELYNRLPPSESAVRYVVGAMAPLDPRYTEITYEEGDRVRNQLDRALKEAGAACDFEYQGSVTSNTHIKSYSDIDLLAISALFHMLERPQEPENPYDGDPIAELKEIRSTTCKTLRKEFPAADVDDTGTKSVCISGGSLRRKIDVVPANWYNTNMYAETQAKRYRAIQILDLKTGKRVKNSPFLHNYLIHELDRKTQGGLRRVIRLMKTLKYDHGGINLSSYDIAAIGYKMPRAELMTSPGGEIALLTRLKLYLDDVKADDELRQEMMTPDESRKVFSSGHATFEALELLIEEVDELVIAVGHEMHKSFGRLVEAQLSY